MTGVLPRNVAIESIQKLHDLNLVYFSDQDSQLSYELKTDGYIGLGWAGFAFLINYANAYIERMNAAFGDLPENLVSTLIPFLNLENVPAADRHVKTTDNLPEFKKLEICLEDNPA